MVVKTSGPGCWSGPMPIFLGCAAWLWDIATAKQVLTAVLIETRNDEPKGC
jgi:hypothetical protein